MTKKTEDNFPVGTKVKLVAGGPVMVVSKPDDAFKNGLRCQWFSGKKLEQGYFPPETLIVVTDDDQNQAS